MIWYLHQHQDQGIQQLKINLEPYSMWIILNQTVDGKWRWNLLKCFPCWDVLFCRLQWRAIFILHTAVTNTLFCRLQWRALALRGQAKYGVLWLREERRKYFSGTNKIEDTRRLNFHLVVVQWCAFISVNTIITTNLYRLIDDAAIPWKKNDRILGTDKMIEWRERLPLNQLTRGAQSLCSHLDRRNWVVHTPHLVVMTVSPWNQPLYCWF